MHRCKKLEEQGAQQAQRNTANTALTGQGFGRRPAPLRQTMAELPRPLVGRILLQARLMELADQAAVVALLQPKQRVGPASSYERTEPYTFLCFYGTASGNICKLARWASGSWGPAVSLPLPKGVDAIAVVRDLAALPALRLRNSSPAGDKLHDRALS